MAIRKIARMGHPVLREPAKPVEDPTRPEIRHILRDMIDTMIDAKGAGLAAPQIYEPLRMVIFEAPKQRAEAEAGGAEPDLAAYAPRTVLINPEIEILTEETAPGWEGCLSVPGLRGLVPRYTHLRYRGINEDGQPIEREARGFHARVVQHECDHLDGVLFPQRMRDMRNLVFESEWVEFREAIQRKRDEQRNASQS